MSISVYAKKNNKKLLYRVLNFSLPLTVLNTISFASDSVSSAISNLNGGEGVYGTIGEIMSILLWLGFAIAIAKMMQIGVMFIIGGGSGKSNAKNALIPWVIGAMVCALFGTIGPFIINAIMGGSSGGVFDI